MHGWNTSRVRDDMFLHLAIGLEGWRCAGGPSLVRLQRSVIDGSQGGVNPLGVEEIDLGKLRCNGGVVADATQFALIAHSPRIVGCGGSRYRNVAGDCFIRADRVHPWVQHDVCEQEQQ